MKASVYVPLLTAAGGIASFMLRLMEVRTGFESSTGLPVPGVPWRPALIALLVLSAVLLAAAVHFIPRETEPLSFSGAFSTTDRFFLLPLFAGVFLMALSGLLDLAGFLAAGDPALRFNALLVQAATALLPALVMIQPICACCRPGSHQAGAGQAAGFRSSLLLVPPLCMMVRLVLVYRLDSVNPALSAYYVELLALVFVTLGFYRLSAFAFQSGRTRPFIWHSGCAVILCCAVLAEGRSLSAVFLYAGCGLTLLDFLLLRLLPKTNRSF